MIDYKIKKNNKKTLFTVEFTEGTMEFLTGEGAPYIYDFLPILVGRILFYLGGGVGVVIDYNQSMQLHEVAAKHKLIANKLNAIDYKIYRIVIDSLATAPSLSVEQVFSIIRRTHELLSGT